MARYLGLYSGLFQTTVQPANPLATANFFSRLTFHWVQRFMIRSSQEQVQPKDMLRIMEEERSHRLFEDLDLAWTRERKR